MDSVVGMKRLQKHRGVTLATVNGLLRWRRGLSVVHDVRMTLPLSQMMNLIL